MISKISKEVTKISFQNFGSNVYFLNLKNNPTLIDTSSKENKEKLINELNKLYINPRDIKTIILTHAHFDHLENLDVFENAKIYGNFKQKINEEHKEIKLKNIIPIEKQPIKELKIYKLPGHTKRDIAILYKNILFSGDIIFEGNYIGRTDFPESIPEKQIESLNKLKEISYKILCAGH